ncbi:AAA family ATPase [Halobacillus sp. BAB-2008]|uniref:ATP-binding protein n=1 Tax=Halobacillus sp. BAB-2008 TaxID=1246484 RepID=UPI0002A4E026|nr:AAA family ATPase [Halobacillus sp. BAB-2008]ELK47651.1 hypothetical protein D479_06125 [Halobacillus sp. BAB-2008]
MKILEWKIYGFGKWNDQSMELSTTQVNLLTGPNEAGKSTLYQFILFMLFGMNPKQRERYLPKSGGAMGGRLVIETETEGVVSIERIHDRHNGRAVCRMETGEEYGEEWLGELLGAADRHVYQSIFSFNSEDLLSLEEVTGENLGELLLNIGLTGSDEIYQTEKWLEKMTEDRFKPKGRKPIINEQLQRLETLDRERRAAEMEEKDYRRFLEEEKRTREELDYLDQAWQENLNRLYRAQQLIKARPVLLQYHQTKEEAEGKDKNLPFPVSGRERYQQLRESLLPLESEQRMLESRIEELREEQAELLDKVDEDMGGLAPSVLAEKEGYERLSHEQEQLEERRLSLNESVNRDLKNMDVPVGVEELDEYTLPFYIEETWRDLHAESQMVEQEERRIEEQWTEMSRTFDRVEVRKAEIEEERISRDQRDRYEKQIEAAYESAAASNPDRQGRTTKDQLYKRRTVGAGAAVGFVLFIGILIASGAGNGWFYLLLLGLAAISGSAAFMSHKRIRILAVSAANKLPISPHGLEEARRQMKREEKLQAEWEHLHQQWKRLSQEEIRLEEKRSHLSQRKNRLDAGIDEQKSLYPFLTSLQLAYWEKLYHLLTRARDKKLELNQTVKRMEENREQLLLSEERLKAFHHQMNWEFNSKDVQRGWQRLSDWIHEQERIDERRQQLEQSILGMKEKAKTCLDRMKVYQDKKYELFSMAGVDKEEDFLLKSKEKEEAEDLHARLYELGQRVEGMLSDEEQQEYAVWSMVPDESFLHATVEKFQAEKEQLEAKKKDTQKLLVETTSKLQSLERSGRRSETAHRFQTEKDRLQEQVKEWAKYQMALQFLRKTKQAYKDGYLPRVMDAAERYFHKLTKGKYGEIFLSEGTEVIQVRDGDGVVYNPEELSRGTRDQLYVSFRLALAETMADSFQLPFLVDDAFVHFDKDRLDTMLQILEDISLRNQVLLFSWRSDLSVHFRSAHTIELTS